MESKGWPFTHCMRSQTHFALCEKKRQSQKALQARVPFTGNSGGKLGEQKASFQQQETGGLVHMVAEGSGWAAGVLMEGDNFVCKISDNSVIFH